MDRAYILHTPSLASRAANVAALDQAIRACGGHNLARVVVSSAEPADLARLPREQLAALVDLAPDRCPVAAYRARVPPHLGLPQLSNAIKHLSALADYAREGASVGLVLEDDCLPVPGTGLDGRLSAATGALLGVQSPALCLLGVSPAGPAEGEQGRELEPLDLSSGPPAACDSYLVNRAAAAALAAAYHPVRFPALEQLAHLCAAGGVRVFRTRVALFRDGSKTRTFVSSLNGAGNRLVFNDRYLALEQGNEEEQDQEGDREHPDLLVLLAAGAARRGRRGRARELYARALAGYEAQHCAVTSAWQFLGDYIALHAPPA
jgi:hypothetical protein